ncbi:hypothetical protein [Psychrobacillus sp. L3]|uniref:hypothetical protein n=1 Tax=Psychrobacillus sp. L3 TaxID=3236891 RepID=UPI0036F3B775
MKELKEKRKEVNTAEEELREVVKKQKELALKEQKLGRTELSEQEGSTDSSLTAEEQKELASIEDVNNTLAKSASSIQTALSKTGK